MVITNRNDKDKERIAITHSQIVSFIWGIADLIRDTFKRGKYQDVILPLTVLRRLDCVLEATKQKVL
jgi:type I restriction enzyme M protein